MFATFKGMSPFRIDEQSVNDGAEGAEQSGEVEGGVSESVIQDLKEAFGMRVAAFSTIFCNNLNRYRFSNRQRLNRRHPPTQLHRICRSGLQPGGNKDDLG